MNEKFLMNTDPRQGATSGNPRRAVPRWTGSLLTVLVLGGSWAAAQAQPPNRFGRSAPPQGPVAPPAPASALLTVADWQKAALQPLQPGEVDRLIDRQLAQNKIQPAPLTTDEQFIRRVTLDLTGELPVPADVTEFVADRAPEKRARLIDKLLDTDEYARHWARYWRDVIASRFTNRQAAILTRPFEEWMTQQLKSNQKWDQIARAMITAEGPARFTEPYENGAAFFLLGHRGPDAANERASETSRVFLGIQIQCAQCHDHPSDQWKRVQFHELAAYFARTGERPVRDGMRLVGLQLVSLPRGEHRMPGKEDPKQTLLTYPSFLDGKAPAKDLGDQERRRALADAVVAPTNFWFAAAFVNRIWGQVEGQSFYQPVDDMGPKKEVAFPEVLTRLTGSFRANHYDVKGLFRDIMSSQTYQRQIRLSESADPRQQFAAANPTRLRPDALWQSLVTVLGKMGGPQGPNRPMGPFGQRFGLEFLFQSEFDFDPSTKPDDVEGSISQALTLMNHPALNQRLQARGTNLLGRILTAYPQDDDALRMVYMRTLARKPTGREIEKCKAYIAKAGNRAEAFEDILWSLLNSTEFQTKR
jgi:uncharacterized protein DUF1549/uncharacterized protein DUF1553